MMNTGNYLLYPRESKEQEEAPDSDPKLKIAKFPPLESPARLPSSSATSYNLSDAPARALGLSSPSHNSSLLSSLEAMQLPSDISPISFISPSLCVDAFHLSSTAMPSSTLGKRKSRDRNESLTEQKGHLGAELLLNVQASKALSTMLSSTLEEVKQLKVQLRAFSMYNQLGTSRSVATADLLEFAVTALGFYLRRSIANDIVTKVVRRDELFGRNMTFWEGDLRDINYMKCWWWMVKSTNKTLARYWREQGYDGPSLSTEWHQLKKWNGSKTGVANLKKYMLQAEMEFSKSVGLSLKEVQFCIGLFLCGPELQRNKDVHLFGLWLLVQGSQVAAKQELNQCTGGQYELSLVEQSCLHPQVIDFSIKDLLAKRMVLHDILNNLNELSPYFVQFGAAIKAIGSFLVKEMVKACGQTVWNIIVESSRPGAGDMFDIAGTYLKWDANTGLLDGLCYAFLCRQDSVLKVAIDEEGHWWKNERNQWVEFQDVLEEVLLESAL